jgi:hypothetical protein
LNALKIRDGAKLPAIKDVDAVVEVWGPANETATSFCVTETRICKRGSVAGDPAPVRYIAMPRKATSPVFAVPSECEGCGAKVDDGKESPMKLPPGSPTVSLLVYLRKPKR